MQTVICSLLLDFHKPFWIVAICYSFYHKVKLFSFSDFLNMVHYVYHVIPMIFLVATAIFQVWTSEIVKCRHQSGYLFSGYFFILNTHGVCGISVNHWLLGSFFQIHYDTWYLWSRNHPLFKGLWILSQTKLPHHLLESIHLPVHSIGRWPTQWIHSLVSV